MRNIRTFEAKSQLSLHRITSDNYTNRVLIPNKLYSYNDYRLSIFAQDGTRSISDMNKTFRRYQRLVGLFNQ